MTDRTLDERRLGYWRAVLSRSGCDDVIPESVAGESVGFRIIRAGAHFDYRYRPGETAEQLLERIAQEMEA